MNYEESQTILEEVKKANSFVLLLHQSPDFDSAMSCLLMAKVLEGMGKKVNVFSFDEIDKDSKFFDKDNKIQVVKYEDVNFSEYEVLFILDANETKRVGLPENFSFNGKIIYIDHHEGNDYSDIHIFDRYAGATGAVLYLIFKDWDIDLSMKDLDMVLLILIYDTWVFHFAVYPGTKVFKIANELIDLGANFEQGLFYAEQCNDLETYQFYAEAIKEIKIDNESRFAYVFISKDLFSKYKKNGVRSRQLTDLFLRNINGTDFCVAMIEEGDGIVKVSVRTRTLGFYVLDLIKEMGGGGHLTGGGATVTSESGNTQESVNTILKYCRDYAQMMQSKKI